jgi:hypothetical protein
MGAARDGLGWRPAEAGLPWNRIAQAAILATCCGAPHRVRPPYHPSQGGFTYVFIIIGALDCIQAVIVIILRAWVNREGGLPDGGANPKNLRVQRRAAAGALQRGTSRSVSASAGRGSGSKVSEAV